MPVKRKTLKKKSVKGGYYGFNGSVNTSGSGPAWSRGSEMGDFAISNRGANAQHGAKRRAKKRGGDPPEEEIVDPPTGQLDAVPAVPMVDPPGPAGPETDPTGGRRRKSRKARKSKKASKTRKMKGGSRFGAVSASYQGKGSAGLIDVAQVNTKYPPFGGAKLGAFNNAGAQPGSGYSSFVKTH